MSQGASVLRYGPSIHIIFSPGLVTFALEVDTTSVSSQHRFLFVVVDYGWRGIKIFPGSPTPS